MGWNRRIFYPQAILLLLSAVVLGGCLQAKLDSEWADREVSIDGGDSDWSGCAVYYDKDSKTSISVLNDNDYLYLLVDSSDRSIMRQMITGGLALWFDPEGGRAKTFGISLKVERPGGMVGDLSSERPSIDESQLRLELNYPGAKKRFSLGVGEAANRGLKLNLKRSAGWFLCELQVPIERNDKQPYAIGQIAEGELGIGFSTEGRVGRLEKLKDGDRDDGMDGIGGRGGMGGMGGGGRGMGMRPGGGRDRMGKQLDLWLKVRLATEGEGADS
ncbi:hypothetical protein ACFLT7_06785 [candidate division KSB1 bacterium]